MNCDMDGAQCPSLPGCNITTPFNAAFQPVAFHALEQVNKTVMMAYFKDSDEMFLRTKDEATKSKAIGTKFAVGVCCLPSASSW